MTSQIEIVQIYYSRQLEPYQRVKLISDFESLTSFVLLPRLCLGVVVSSCQTHQWADLARDRQHQLMTVHVEQIPKYGRIRITLSSYAPVLLQIQFNLQE